MKTNRSRSAPARWPTPVLRRGWSIVHTVQAISIRAEPDQLATLYLDYDGWPSLFPATIRHVRRLAQNDSSITVEVDHRTEGRVLNVIRPRSPTVIALDERKRRYDATFMSRFEPAPGGSRYVLEAAVRFRKPYSLIAPLLRPIVSRRMRAFVLEPMRDAAERHSAAPRRRSRPVATAASRRERPRVRTR